MNTVEHLDLGVAQRQAFGSIQSYSKPKNYQQLVEKYWQGNLVLPPHPDWEGDPTDWRADPFGDKNWQFQQHTLRWLNPLRWIALEGDDRARKEWVRVVKNWADNNVPASSDLSPYAWKDMSDGNRAIQISLGAPLVEARDDWFVRLLEYHRDWLMDENHIVGKNHGLHQHAGLLVVSAVLRDDEAKNVAYQRMRVQFESTFDRQGTNDEGSFSYHQMNIKWWSQAWKRADLEGLTPPKAVTERLSSAATVLAHMAMPNGQLPQIGDSARGKISSGHSAEADFVASSGKIGRPPKNKALVLDRGYVLSRSGWGEERDLTSESHMVLRHGEDLRSHSHNDRGSVHIYSDGKRWLVDSGFHSYRAALPENKYLRSRLAHNVLHIPGVKHDPKAVVELIRHRITESFHDFSLVDHGFGAHKPLRRVVYFVEADCWVVSDQILGEQKLPLSQNWHTEPGVQIRSMDNGYRLATGTKRFGMRWLGKGTRLRRLVANDDALDAWIGTKWRTMTPSTRLIAESGSNRPHLVALLFPYRDAPLGLVESRVTATGVIEMHVTRGRQQWNMVINDTNVRVGKP